MKTFSKFILFLFVGFLALVLGSFLANECFADSIKCYADGKLVYSRHVYNVNYVGDIIVFNEEATGDFVFFNGLCITKLPGE